MADTNNRGNDPRGLRSEPYPFRRVGRGPAVLAYEWDQEDRELDSARNNALSYGRLPSTGELGVSGSM